MNAACPAAGSRPAFLRQTAGDMVESALTLPLMALLTLALVNLALVGHARAAAQHAAHFGARMGSVALADAEGEARQAAGAMLDACLCEAQVTNVSGADAPGGEVIVTVEWTVPSFLGSLLSVFGGAAPEQFTGAVTAAYRKEGW